jgi:ketosteroid isomerase-like protein
MSLRVRMLALLAVLVSACATPEPPVQQPRDVSSEVGAANEQFAAAFGALDAEALAGLYMTDAKLLPPSSDFVTGRGAIQTFWQGVMDAGVASASLTTEEAIAVDSLAFEVGRYALADADGNPIDEGKYIVIWRLTADGWKLHRDIWNSSRVPA